MEKNEDSTSSRLNKYVEKFGIYVAGVLVSIGSFLWTGMDSRVKNLEEKVSFLYQDKVSRAELKEEMQALRSQNEQTKNDILARLELIIKLYSRNEVK